MIIIIRLNIGNTPPSTEGAAVIQDQPIVAREEHGYRVPPTVRAIDDFWFNHILSPHNQGPSHNQEY